MRDCMFKSFLFVLIKLVLIVNILLFQVCEWSDMRIEPTLAQSPKVTSTMYRVLKARVDIKQGNLGVFALDKQIPLLPQLKPE